MALPVLAAAMALSAALNLQSMPQAPPQNLDGTPQTSSQFIAARVYRALLGREGDPAAVAAAAADIDANQLRRRVNSIVLSPEFRSHIYGLPPEEILAQVYQGLLDHGPGADAASWRRLITLAKYADVISGLIATPEFKTKLAAIAPAAPAVAVVPPEGTVAAPVPAPAAMSGIMPPVTAAAAAPPTAMTPPAAPPAKPASASEAWSACQTAIGQKAQQESGASRVVFQTPEVTASGPDTQTIRGRAQSIAAGGAAVTFTYTCDVKGAQVLAATILK